MRIGDAVFVLTDEGRLEHDGKVRMYVGEVKIEKILLTLKAGQRIVHSDDG